MKKYYLLVVVTIFFTTFSLPTLAEEEVSAITFKICPVDDLYYIKTKNPNGYHIHMEHANSIHWNRNVFITVHETGKKIAVICMGNGVIIKVNNDANIATYSASQ